MILAAKKRESNIAEYVIFIWQTEDLIRAYQFDLAQIQTSIINHLPLSDEEKNETLGWYEKLIKEMNEQAITSSGHLKCTKDLVNELYTLHHTLTEVVKDTFYNEIYEKAHADFVLFRSLQSNASFNDIEICLNAVYGLLLLRLENKVIPEDLMASIDRFGSVLSYLAIKFREKEKGMWN